MQALRWVGRCTKKELVTKAKSPFLKLTVDGLGIPFFGFCAESASEIEEGMFCKCFVVVGENKDGFPSVSGLSVCLCDEEDSSE